jgi:hypothetical protein
MSLTTMLVRAKAHNTQSIVRTSPNPVWNLTEPVQESRAMASKESHCFSRVLRHSDSYRIQQRLELAHSARKDEAA